MWLMKHPVVADKHLGLDEDCRNVHKPHRPHVSDGRECHRFAHVEGKAPFARDIRLNVIGDIRRVVPVQLRVKLERKDTAHVR